jgi:glyoxylase-like metal-dependent hydrolase (beta-lactamase superfamily II)
MTKRFFTFALLAAASASISCAATNHPTTSVQPGVVRSSLELEALVDQPGPLRLETITAAKWEVDLSGLVNLDHPAAKAAQLVDKAEPIDLYVHVIRHPQRGTFFVDTGVERAFSKDPDNALIHGLMGSLANLERLRPLVDTDSLVRRTGPVAGVLLTHLHADHVLGMRDLPASTPIYVGPGDAHAHAFMNLLMRGLYDQALEHKGALREISFSPDASGRFAGVRDLFGDGSLWALWLPGHTPGTLAFVARTTQGPVLLTGDVCHTAWGWQHGVEPGKFSDNPEQSADSFARLQRFVKEHPSIDVRLGHQAL